MKILVALHHVMDLGGIINHTEQLIGGLKDLGHEVDFRELVWSHQVHANNKDGDWIIGPSGIPHDQGKGWNFPREKRIAYSGVLTNFARQIMEEFDLIIWTVPVPSKNARNAGNSDWPRLYDLKNPKQIAFIHDGNSEQGYPHLLHIEDKLEGIACVHECALNSSSHLTARRALILNPQENPVREVPSWDEKLPGFVNMQTFKAWKHAHELIEAIAYMPDKRPVELRHVAGEGIEYRYMKSEDKCKEAYFHSGSLDKWFAGWKFWDAALGNDMQHDGYWNSEQVDEMLRKARVLVDPSWSNKYSLSGGHFNRVAVDAMIRGAVPVGRELGFGSGLFKPHEHYVPIPQAAGPQEYADIVLSTAEMPKSEALEYREAALEILPRFDRQFVAQQVIDLAHRNLDGDESFGTPKKVADKRDEILFNHFGIATA